MDLILKIEKGRLVAEKVKDGEEGRLFDFKLKQIELARDKRGRPVTSCIVEKAEPTEARAKAEPPKREGKWPGVLRALFNRLAESDKASYDEATGEKRVDLEELRRSFVERAAAEISRSGARSAWGDLLKKLPQGYVVRPDATGSKYMVFAP